MKQWNPARLLPGRKKLPPYVTENVTEELIRLENLVKIYDTGAIKVLGLKKINLTIRRGEFVAIMGHADEYSGMSGPAYHGTLLSGRH